MCKCSHTTVEHKKLWVLLEDEKKAREQLLKHVDSLLGSSNQAYLGACEDLLLAVKDYMLGMQILTDSMRLELPQDALTQHDTDPQRMNSEKAPDTERSARTKFNDEELIPR